MGNPTKVHIAYESITDDRHRGSPHMRQRLSGIISENFPDCEVIHLAKDSEESEKNCLRLCLPDIAILSITLPGELAPLVARLLERAVTVVLLYRQESDWSERKCEFGFEGVWPVETRLLKHELPTILSAHQHH